MNRRVVLMLVVAAGFAACGDTNHEEPTAPTAPVAWAVAAGSTVGLVGCSLTGQAVAGYHESSTEHALWPMPPYGSGTLRGWAQGVFWARFDSLLAVHGADAIWWNICISPEQMSDVDQQPLQAAQVYYGIRQRLPTVPIYVSPMNVYQVGVLDSWTAAQRRTVQLEQWITTVLPTLHGPVLGPLDAEYTLLWGPTDPHLTSAGEAFVGRQLVDVFDVP